jgi:hypothetical protein
METWKDDPHILWLLLSHQAAQNPALRRQLTILDVLTRRGFTPWKTLVETVESEVGAGCYGKSPQARLWGDLRALRAAGIGIGYSRRKGMEGYFLHYKFMGERVATVLDQVFRELDFEHLDRIAKFPPERRLQAMFDMIDFIHEVSEAGKRERGQ